MYDNCYLRIFGIVAVMSIAFGVTLYHATAPRTPEKEIVIETVIETVVETVIVANDLPVPLAALPHDCPAPVCFGCEEHSESVYTIIKQVCNRRDFDYRIAYAVAYRETMMNPKAVNSTSGTVGLYQFNLKYCKITEEQAKDPLIATEYFIQIVAPLIEKYGLYDAMRCYAVGEYNAFVLDRGHTAATTIFKIMGELEE